MIKLEYVYTVAGIFLAILAYLALKDKGNPRRLTTALFWGLFAVVFLFGDHIPPMIVGMAVLLMALLAGSGGVRMGTYPQTTEKERQLRAEKLGHVLFLPALLIPLLTMIGSVALKHAKIGSRYLLDQANVTLVSLGVSCVLALLAALIVTRERSGQALQESRRLLDAIGWAAVLPQMLATLGGIFAAAGVGDAVAELVRSVIPVDNRFLVVAAYAVGMALFTMIMGNAFAAFPVMTAGVGLPLIVHLHGGNPAVMAAIGMYSGYCGTLMTPMAANFNIVPAALLDLPDKNAVIKAQVLTALPLLGVNILLMYLLVF